MLFCHKILLCNLMFDVVYDEIKNTATKYCKIKRIGLPNENLFHEQHS